MREGLCSTHKAIQLQWNKADESQRHSSVSPRGKWLMLTYCCESTTLSESTVRLFPPFPNRPCHPALLPTPTRPHTHTLKAVSCHSLRAGASAAQRHPQGSEAREKTPDQPSDFHILLGNCSLVSSPNYYWAL